ncbi:N-formylglutamate amidohydrolase [Aquimarina sp. 2201CG14-23]|uniref:N-formylglutamate amidohydrolase n=1 Tax=Aquimarina mycalae TaxID=3040073 RepID=UPI002477F75A|nr:N-formylglutamate amidohydrolase [Aquimarina sp. 2201CG14-23]MDH7445610.1 N-formylglutamate amidohydrolase [Aquimarina sp. 2201CG14-23]
MHKFSIDEIINKINNEETFHAIAEDYSFTLKIDSYSYYICGAIHDGHQFRKDLWELCLHTEYERWYEEDPCTKQMVQSHPIVIAGCDSRFEYDLNRDPKQAVYVDAWGKQLWRSPLSQKAKDNSLQKHHNFYKVIHALISKIESKFGAAIVYDMHSYNWRRWDRKVPVINLGTSNIDNKRFSPFANSWSTSLSKIKLPNNIETTTAINDTFQGNGYFLKYITNHFDNTLVLATEFSKIYCDELEYKIYPEVVHAIEQELKSRLPAHALSFYKSFIEIK